MSLIDITELTIPETTRVNRLPTNTYLVDDTNRNVYSRRSGQPTRVFGTIKGNHRWYTLMPRQSHESAVYIREDRLLRALQARQLGIETATVKPSAETDVATGRWIIGTVTADGQYSFAARPRIHESEASVNVEAERLAINNPGTTYVKVLLAGQVTAGGVHWS